MSIGLHGELVRVLRLLYIDTTVHGKNITYPTNSKPVKPAEQACKSTWISVAAHLYQGSKVLASGYSTLSLCKEKGQAKVYCIAKGKDHKSYAYGSKSCVNGTQIILPKKAIKHPAVKVQEKAIASPNLSIIIISAPCEWSQPIRQPQTWRRKHQRPLI